MNQRSQPIKLRFRDSYITTPQLPVIEMEEIDGIAEELKGLPSNIKYIQ